MKVTSISLPHEVTDKIDQTAGRTGLSRSWIIGYLLKDPTATNRLQALERIASIEISQPIANRDEDAHHD